MTGTQVLLLVVSETGLVYTFTTPKLQPLVTKAEGKNLIQVCDFCSIPKEIRLPEPGLPQAQAPRHMPTAPTGYMTQEQQQQAIYYQQLQQQNQSGQYAGMPQMPTHQRA